MRYILVAVALLFAPDDAAAQSAPEPLLPLGPFTFGMSPEAARAAVPEAEWEVVDDVELRRGSMLTREPVIEFNGFMWRALLSYAGNSVTFMQLRAELPLSASDCDARHRAIVEAEMPARGPFTGRDYWRRFYEAPDGPIGSMDGDTFVPAPSIDARSQIITITNPSLQYNSVIASFSAPEYDQAFQRASNRRGEISAHAFIRAGAPVCQLAVQSRDPRTSGGIRISSGSEEAERWPEHLEERLAAAEFARPITYLTLPDPANMARLYPPRAMVEEVEGPVVLSCLVLADGTLDCIVQESPQPPELGFAESALRAIGGYRADVFAENSVGKRTELTIQFRLAH